MTNNKNLLELIKKFLSKFLSLDKSGIKALNLFFDSNIIINYKFI